MVHTETTPPGLLPALGLIMSTGLLLAVLLIGSLYGLSQAFNWLLGQV